MKKLVPHVRTYVIRGFWAAIPVVLSFYAVQLLYLSVDQRIVSWIAEESGSRIPGLGLVILLLSFYLLGLLASNVIGRRALMLMERLTDRLPLVKTIYRVGKQLSDTFSHPENEVFRRAVLVEYLKPGIWTLGFVTGAIVDSVSRQRLLKVYVPTPPNPTSGTLVFVPESEIRDPGWTVDEAMKSIISAGIVTPGEFRPARLGG